MGLPLLTLGGPEAAPAYIVALAAWAAMQKSLEDGDPVFRGRLLRELWPVETETLTAMTHG